MQWLIKVDYNSQAHKDRDKETRPLDGKFAGKTSRVGVPVVPGPWLYNWLVKPRMCIKKHIHIKSCFPSLWSKMFERLSFAFGDLDCKYLEFSRREHFIRCPWKGTMSERQIHIFRLSRVFSSPEKNFFSWDLTRLCLTTLLGSAVYESGWIALCVLVTRPRSIFEHRMTDV